jgi:hypothetical protein
MKRKRRKGCKTDAKPQKPKKSGGTTKMFRAEYAAYEAMKGDLLRLCSGKFAVFHGKDYLGCFDTSNAAYAAGLAKWGNVSFLIQVILKEKRMVAIY